MGFDTLVAKVQGNCFSCDPFCYTFRITLHYHQHLNNLEKVYIAVIQARFRHVRGGCHTLQMHIVKCVQLLTHAHTRACTYSFITFMRRAISHTLQSHYRPKSKCVAMSLMQLKWKQMQVVGKSVPECVKQWEVESTEGERERERRKYLIISAHFAHVHCGSLITSIVLVSCHLQINSRVFFLSPMFSPHRI